MSKKKLLILIAVLIAVLLAAVAAFVATCYYLPWSRAVSTLGEGKLLLQEQEDGRILVSWPEGQGAEQYLFEIVDPLARETVYSRYLSGQTCHLIDPLPNRKMTLRISSVASYKVPFETAYRTRIGQRITVTDNLSTPAVTDISWTPEPNADQVHVKLTLTPNSQGRLYALDEQNQPGAAVMMTDGQAVLSFGEGQTYPIPREGQFLGFVFDAFREGKNYTFHSRWSEAKYLVREDLLDTELRLTYRDNGDNYYTILWNETFGRTYRLEARQAGTEFWRTLTIVEGGENRSFSMAQMGILEAWEFRVICPDTAPMLQSEIMTLRSGPSLRYSTIWPIKELPVYADADMSNIIGSVPGAQAFCLLAEENGLFRIRFADTFGYIDSNYCMINLPQYLGHNCLYNITNSYQSLYKAHDYDIPNVTGSLVTGYEQVMVGDGEYLVPLLYPVAKKLAVAAVDALQRGYKLLIYDSFRPQSATAALHDLALGFAEGIVPGAELENPEKPMTFGDYMTDYYRYTLSNFIAKGRSRHNLGIALDLTLVAVAPETLNPLPDPEAPPLPEGEEPVPTVGPDGELIMQTPMHDLTWYSERKQNNDNANLLRQIMEGAGFGGIASEWWHYQDNETYNTFAPPPLWDGVTPEGWVTSDGETWRYRDQFGQYLTDCVADIDGETYSFDINGVATWQETTNDQMNDQTNDQEGDFSDQVA